MSMVGDFAASLLLVTNARKLPFGYPSPDILPWCSLATRPTVLSLIAVV